MNPFNVDPTIIPLIPFTSRIILVLFLLGGVWAFSKLAESVLEFEFTAAYIDFAKKISIHTESFFFGCFFAQLFLGVWCWYNQMPPMGLYPHPLTLITMAFCPIMLFCSYWIIVSLCTPPTKEIH